MLAPTNERETHTRDKRDKQGRVGRGSHGSPARREEEGARGCGRGQPQPGARDGTREEHVEDAKSRLAAISQQRDRREDRRRINMKKKSSSSTNTRKRRAATDQEPTG